MESSIHIQYRVAVTVKLSKGLSYGGIFIQQVADVNGSCTADAVPENNIIDNINYLCYNLYGYKNLLRTKRRKEIL